MPHRVQAGGLGGEVLPAVVDLIAGEQVPDERDGLLEHLQPLGGARPPGPHDVLVECFPAAQPKVKRPRVSRADVAAAWATSAGWMRMIGQVTAVVMGSEEAWEIATMTDHTKLDWPCSSSQGWKWSDIHSASKPACSASLACLTSSAGSYSSEDRK